MSIADAARFAKDLATDKEFVAKVKDKVSGLASLVELGKAHGYLFTLEEIKQFVRSAVGRDLTDDQLDAVAGGQGAANKAGESSPVGVATNVNANVNTQSLVLDYGTTEVVALAVVVGSSAG